MNVFKFFLIFFIIKCFYCSDKNETKDIDFIPTKDWKIVKDGQKIPPGLHVRSNLQTGITEAKILSEIDRNSNTMPVIIAENNNTILNGTINSYSSEQLKRMIKNIKDENVIGNKTELNGTKFRSYEQLKKEFESIQMSIKTDLEIIRELLDELQGNLDIQRTIIILKDLEYYLHQIDNAQNFVDMGGLVYLHKFIESDEKDIKSEALRCLSSAIQGNSKVKVEALKNGTLTHVLTQLKYSSDTSVINQILVVVSALTRQFPTAQLAFIRRNGLQISGDVFDKFSINEDGKIGIRLITLLSDWSKERDMKDFKNVAFSDKDIEIIAEKENQYKKINLQNALLKHGWCARLNSLISTRNNRSVDYLEKLITSINNLYRICRYELDKDHLQAFLEDSHKSLFSFAKEEVDDFYFKDILILVNDTLSLIKDSEQYSKDEL